MSVNIHYNIRRLSPLLPWISQAARIDDHEVLHLLHTWNMDVSIHHDVCILCLSSGDQLLIAVVDSMMVSMCQVYLILSKIKCLGIIISIEKIIVSGHHLYRTACRDFEVLIITLDVAAVYEQIHRLYLFDYLIKVTVLSMCITDNQNLGSIQNPTFLQLFLHRAQSLASVADLVFGLG